MLLALANVVGLAGRDEDAFEYCTRKPCKCSARLRTRAVRPTRCCAWRPTYGGQGRGAESRALARKSLSSFEQVEAGPELALAYNNESVDANISGLPAEALTWAEKAFSSPFRGQLDGNSATTEVDHRDQGRRGVVSVAAVIDDPDLAVEPYLHRFKNGTSNQPVYVNDMSSTNGSRPPSGLRAAPGHALLTEQAGDLLAEFPAFVAEGPVVLKQRLDAPVLRFVGSPLCHGHRWTWGS